MMLPMRHAGVEAADGVLEDDLHLSAESAELFAVVGEEIFALEATVPAVAGMRRRIDAADGGFAAAGFTDEAEGFAGVRCRS